MLYPTTKASSPLHPTLDELVGNPSLTQQIAKIAIPQILTEIASREAALKALEGMLLFLLTHANRNDGNNSVEHSQLLSAPELAKLWGVPQSWVREQARLGKLPSFKIGHYVRFRIEEVERCLTERASQAA